MQLAQIGQNTQIMRSNHKQGRCRTLLMRAENSSKESNLPSFLAPAPLFFAYKPYTCIRARRTQRIIYLF